jgi:hypothetical protein
LRDIDHKNGLIKKALNNPNNTVKNKELNIRWKKQQELQNLIRKSAKPPVSKILVNRDQYLESVNLKNSMRML